MVTEVDQWIALNHIDRAPHGAIKQQLRKFRDTRCRFMSGIAEGHIDTRKIDIYEDRVVVSDYWVDKGEARFKG